MKKFMMLLLAASLTVTAAAGCSKETKDTEENGAAEISLENLGDTGGIELPIDKNNTKLTWVVCSDVENINDKLIVKKIREITGIDLQLEAYPASTISDKVKMLIASKKVPDIIGEGIKTISELNDYGVQGAFAPVSDYLDIMPNFKRIFKDNSENEWVFKSYQAADGKMYAIPGYELNREVNHGVLYRKDVFDKHGIEMWNSPEEFYEALKKLKEIYPSSYPFTSKNADAIFDKIAVSWGISLSSGAYYDEQSGTWKCGSTDPAYKEELDYIRKLYDEELIDPEFLTLTQAQWTSRMTQDNVSFVTWDWIGRLDMFTQQVGEQNPEYDLRYGNPIGPKQTITELPKVDFPIAVANNKNTELALKLVDFLYSDAGKALISMGIEGETYNIGSDGMAEYIGMDGIEKIEITDLEDKYGLYIEGMYRSFDKRSSYFRFSEREQEAQDYAKDPAHLEPQDPILSFTDEEQAEITKYLANLLTASKEFSVNYILTDKTGDSAWNEWVKKAEDLGSEKIVKIYNDAQKRYDNQ